MFPFTLGIAIGLRFVFYILAGQSAGHVQSLILAAVLLIMGFLTFLLAIISDLLSVNRRLLEELQRHQRARLLHASDDAFHGVQSIDSSTLFRQRGTGTVAGVE
jgi:hypothetical protein